MNPLRSILEQIVYKSRHLSESTDKALILDLCQEGLALQPDGWINRNERLPEKDGQVRVWLRAVPGGDDAQEAIIWFSPSIKKFSFDNQHVTHWQPLSEPPTIEQEVPVPPCYFRRND